MVTRLQGGGGCPKWPQKGLRNICIAPIWQGYNSTPTYHIKHLSKISFNPRISVFLFSKKSLVKVSKFPNETMQQNIDNTSAHYVLY